MKKRSGLSNAKMPLTGWHKSSPRYHPIREIGSFFAELTVGGMKLALTIGREGGRWAKPKLEARINELQKHIKEPEHG